MQPTGYPARSAATWAYINNLSQMQNETRNNPEAILATSISNYRHDGNPLLSLELIALLMSTKADELTDNDRHELFALQMLLCKLAAAPVPATLKMVS